MAFIWNTQPNPPSTDLPIPVPPGELTYEQRVVANLVNAGGTLSYNTPNVGFDILYQLPTANVSVANFTNATFDNITVNTANITTATINVANIQTANILNANIRYGYVGSDPTSNLGIASKHYADAAAANVPTGGSDLQNIIDAKGDLLVGTGFHTATRLPKGSDGQILMASAVSNTGLKWISVTGQELFYDLLIQTHYDLSSNDHQVILRSASQIIMNDGTRTSAWGATTADIEVSGAGGLDTGSEQNSRWYEVHAIRKSGDGSRSLLLHLAQNTLQDQSLTTTTDVGVTLKRVTGGTATMISQSFIPALSGPLTSVELEISKTGSPTGLVWVTIEADNAGFPSGTPLATSRAMNVARLPTDKARMRFVFDTNTSISVSNTYHIVYQSNYTTSDANYTTIWGLIASGYVNGSANEFRVAWFTSSGLGGAADLWFKTFVKVVPVSAVVMPSGYDQRCLLSYVYNNSSGKFKQYHQKNRTMVMGMSLDWRCFSSVTGLIEAVDLGPFMPPVDASVYFTHLLNPGGPRNINNPIGGIACTDLPTTDTPTGGQVTANTSDSTTAGLFCAAQYGTLVVEGQTILCRMQNVAARLYVTGLAF